MQGVLLSESSETQFDFDKVETTTLHLPIETAEPVLAVGAELKSSLCILDGNQAVFTGHLGDLAQPVKYRNFLTTVERLQHRLGVKPEVVAYDLHPGYTASRYARSLGLKSIGVQHHHAHIVAAMADNNLTGEVIGVVCDGTGYGTDNSVWGCEILLSSYADFKRAGHLRPFPLVGGDTAAIETWRPATALLHETFEYFCDEELIESCISRIDPISLQMMRSKLKIGKTLQTSSLGRLFDAIAFMLDICDRNDTEAEAPIALEAAASSVGQVEPLSWQIETGQALQMDYRPMIRELFAGLNAGRSREELARAFHETVAAMLADCTKRIADQTGLDRIVFSGGCFLNRLINDRLRELLEAAGLKIFATRSVPVSDVGISLGQAVSAAARLQK